MKSVRSSAYVQKNIPRIAAATAAILVIPLIAMQFSDDVNWTVFDFAVAGILLFSSGLAYLLLARRTKSKKQRLIIALTVALVLLFVWVELAVGLFGSPFAGS